MGADEHIEFKNRKILGLKTKFQFGFTRYFFGVIDFFREMQIVLCAYELEALVQRTKNLAQTTTINHELWS